MLTPLPEGVEARRAALYRLVAARCRALGLAWRFLPADEGRTVESSGVLLARPAWTRLIGALRGALPKGLTLLEPAQNEADPDCQARLAIDGTTLELEPWDALPRHQGISLRLLALDLRPRAARRGAGRRALRASRRRSGAPRRRPMRRSRPRRPG